MDKHSRLPSWVMLGELCRWHSTSTKAVHSVKITSVDPVKRRVIVHFEKDKNVWKEIPFSYLSKPDCSLKPIEGAKKSASVPEVRAPPKSQAQPQAKSGDDKKAAGGADDGTATPPWWDQLNTAESREELAEADKKKVEEDQNKMTQKQQERKLRWEQAQREKAHKEALARAEEKKKAQAKAEEERLKILDKLQKERLVEQMLEMEQKRMKMEDEMSEICINAPVRLAIARAKEAERQAREEMQQRVIMERMAREAEEKRRRDEEQRRIREEQQRQQRQFFEEQQRVEREAREAEERRRREEDYHRRAEEMRLHELERNLPRAAKGVTDAEYYGPRFCLIYERHNKAKLSELPGLMQKYAGHEADMYDKICEKYNVKPDVHLQEGIKLAEAEAEEQKRYARKAAPPQQPPLLATTAKGRPPPPPPMQGKPLPIGQAPSSSNLLARFQTLVHKGDDGDVSDDGAPMEDDRRLTRPARHPAPTSARDTRTSREQVDRHDSRRYSQQKADSRERSTAFRGDRERREPQDVQEGNGVRDNRNSMEHREPPWARRASSSSAAREAPWATKQPIGAAPTTRSSEAPRPSKAARLH
eukprot:TRINITY_DN50168_c0_g1_i1.p1 TRINITY_DN50168_c0_g1~~TRINITY_DN50168_c0_g1_i1.p1  ORF type:complete len:589 (+),score=163.78 TRINITY_DN50168_c0_g1_i1:99-1865(+)